MCGIKNISTPREKEEMDTTKKHRCDFALESPQGEFSVGVCHTCGAKKEFANAPENALIDRYKNGYSPWNDMGFERKNND